MIGRLIDGRYQVRSRIARGGMATVYLATDLRLERRVALKIMHSHLADDHTFKSRFVQEARSAARLAHPNVVNVFDQGQDADMAYLVMEYLPGITLRDLLKDYGKLTAEQTVDILEAVLAGLAAAHKAGIVHRDMKPENVLLADDGRIKLGDFGLARAVSANTGTGQALLGTIAYLSPELVTRGVADARSDIYALGIMMYEMLTGEQPFVGEAPMQIAYQHANEQVPAPSLKNPEIPAQLDELVLWATARDPENRPRDARVMLDSLLAAESSMPRPHALATESLDQPTMVLHGSFDSMIADAETQVINPQVRMAQTGPQRPASPGGRLATIASHRKRKGWWLFALVLLLAGVAGGAGWFFGAGPGSQVQVPVTIGLGIEEATAVLQDAGFTVQPGERSDVAIPLGEIAGTDPPTGAYAAKGSTVILYTSQGPAMVDVPAVINKPEEKARTLLAASFTVVEESITEFSSDIDAGNVISVRGVDGNPLGETYGEKQPVTLVVSLGAIPDVSGKTVQDALDTLEAVGLNGVPQDPEFSDDVPADHVIEQINPDGVVTSGADISLRVSKGQDLVEVPDVVGDSMADAIKELRDAGFTVSYNLPDIFIPVATTISTDPAAGTMVKRNSTITLKGQLTL